MEVAYAQTGMQRFSFDTQALLPYIPFRYVNWSKPFLRKPKK
jgi:hypothetical protein